MIVAQDVQRSMDGQSDQLFVHSHAIYGRAGRGSGTDVYVSNQAAIRLYRSFGFRPVGIRPNYYVEDQEDAVVMLLDRHAPPR